MEKHTLPEAFLGRMKKLLGNGYGDFLASYGEQARKGIRANLLKTDREELLEKLPEDFKADTIP